MCDGTGLCGFSKGFPERFFDVGIAEEHAVTFCAGLAAAGKIPVFAVYSSFLQRCFDQLIHDIAIQNLHVVICVDRAGFVGGDGVTHQGLFDVGMALSVPNTKVWSPDGFDELRKCLEEAVLSDGLCIVRYPKGGEKDYDRAAFEEYDGFSVFDAKEKPEATVVTYGRITKNVATAAEKLGHVRVVKLLRSFSDKHGKTRLFPCQEKCFCGRGHEKRRRRRIPFRNVPRKKHLCPRRFGFYRRRKRGRIDKRIRI